MVIFMNPSLLSLLKTLHLDMYEDATFDCAPCPFYQSFIMMVYNHETASYMLVLYALMSHKNPGDNLLLLVENQDKNLHN